MGLQERFKEFMKLNMLERPNWQNQSYVLGVSGGVDSMVLLDLFCLGFEAEQIVVAHLDHGIRLESSDEREFVETVCRDLGVRCVAQKIDVTKLPGNLEANARQIRYNFFEQVKRDYNCDWVVTAHHANDQAETVLSAFLKGAFIKGLSGMEFLNEQRGVMRPLLFAQKQELEDYAKSKSLRWIVDQSNFDSTYDRNFLRNEIIPDLEERFEGLVNRLNEATSFYRDLDDYLLEKVDRWIGEHGKLENFGWVIDLRSYVKSPNFLRFMILQKLSGQVEQLDMGKANFGDIDDMLLRGNSGRWKEIANKFVYIFGQKILVSNMELGQLENYYFETVSHRFADELAEVKNQIVRYEDGMKVEVSYGDNGKGGEKEVLLKEFLKQQNIPWFFRKGVPVLLDKKGLVERCWVL